MEDELLSMDKNGVWILVDRTDDMKPIRCKWIFKTKKDANGRIERHKARLVAKGYTQQEGIDYNETFSPVSTKDAFRVLMAHYDLELHQMDFKTAFLNGELAENIYMLRIYTCYSQMGLFKMKTKSANLKDLFMDSNKHPDNGI